MSPSPQLHLNPQYERRASIQSSCNLPRPSLVAARAYYLNQILPIGLERNAIWWRGSLTEIQQITRRHSTFSRPEDLAQHVANLKVVSPSHAVSDNLTTSTLIKLENPKPETLRLSTQHAIVDNIKAPREAEPLSADTDVKIHPIPLQFTHDHLRDWGYAYLGNLTTADALVNAVALRRQSVALVNQTTWHEDTSMVTIRARVIPRSKHRLPFLIYKEFDIDQFRASLPFTKSEIQSPSITLRRSSRHRRFSAQLMPSQATQRRGSTHTTPKSQAGVSLKHNERVAIPMRKY